MTSPATVLQPDSCPLAGSETHGTKRSRDMPSLDHSHASDLSDSPPSPPSSNSIPIPASDLSLNVHHPVLPHRPITPLAKKGRHLAADRNIDFNNSAATYTSEGPGSSNEGSDNGNTKSRRATPEANEVKSVRKKVEGMGVETEPDQQPPLRDEAMSSQAETTFDPAIPPIPDSHPDSASTATSPAQRPSSTVAAQSDPRAPSQSGTLPSSWAAYASVESPFTAFAPQSTVSIFATSPADDPNPSSTVFAPPRPLARAFASSPLNSPGKPAHSPFPSAQTGSSSLASTSAKFPSGSDFFLKGKRNTPLGGLVSEHDTSTSGQHKKVKLPQSSAAGADGLGFGGYASGKSTSLRPAALEQLNNDPNLQTSSAAVPFLNAYPPPSAASSVCAVNGDTDEPLSPSPSVASGFLRTTAPSPTPLGFSSFARPAGFSEPPKDGPPGSVFDQTDTERELTPGALERADEGDERGGKAERKTHLALSAELSHEDKHEGFSAKEVVTGEENEDLVKSVRCKLFALGEDGSWHERGSGGLRLLCTKDEPRRYRLIMRADAVLRVLVNVPIFKGFSYRPSQEKFLSFASTIVTGGDSGAGSGAEGKAQFQQYLCRFARPEARQEMMDSINHCMADLESRQDGEGGESVEALGVTHLETYGGEEGGGSAEFDQLRGAEMV